MSSIRILSERCSRLILVYFFIILLIAPLSSQAEELETQQSLEQTINAFILPKLTSLNARKVDTEIGRIDPRLRLKKCLAPHEVDILGNNGLSGKVNIRIRCPESSWGIFVPVNIRLYEPVVVSRVTLPRGSLISADQVILKEMDTSELNYSFFRKTEQVVGTETTRSIQANSVIFANMIQAADAIRKGDSVIIKAQIGNLSVRIKGEAIQSGAIGEQIQVRNIQSKRIIKAIVTGPGNVTVPM